MTVYIKLKACCLDVEVCSWNKAYNVQKDGRQATEKLRENYEGSGEVNKRVAWAMEKIDNAHLTIKHTYSFENFSTV